MNDRHPSGTATPPAPAPEAASAHYASYGEQGVQYGDFTTHDGCSTTGFDANAPGMYGATGSYDTTGAYATTTFDTDPLFGDLPGNGGGNDGSVAGTGSYDATQWATGSHQTLNYDPYAAQHHAAFETGSYDTSGVWSDSGHQQLGEIPTQAAGPEGTGQWDANAWLQADPVDPTQQWTAPTFETGTYDATAWNSDGGDQNQQNQTQVQPQIHHQAQAEHESYPADQHTSAVPHTSYEHHDAYNPHESYESYESYDQQATSAFEQVPYEEQATAEGEFTPSDDADADSGTDGHSHTHDEPAPFDDVEETTSVATDAPAGRSASRAAGRSAPRSRRRTPPKRSALLTVAVPSACVMGVAGIAAASVTGGSSNDDVQTTAAAPDTSTMKPSAANNQLDTQLENLSTDADDFADRASRTQERIDLKAQQAAERQRAAAEAARKERLRPKFALPVTQKGLSASFGQAGVNWMSTHTGIDFPVSYGTTVMAVADGTVRTQWNSSYGNMVILTTKDGTEIWYCHLATYQVASGTVVKAGDPVAYSGNSGNSTGPHLHIEVRPGGGSAIDPLPWLRSHGLDPT
ncbi:peptidoglycan DD-metalloendopeptidase family protein [Streptomyces sp. ActVer]|uniref:peptidoglycan DD-metalloendopeptidase family protein n=1 Tax=Streptomyces sp. ActVer TaxID=3014558 RepID=UPI0022B309C2|nr:peptidoglycan DD-metalloendopeptidase family protein [Streptomyces sp. ActVer]MCZ4511342.1 peptidoglycan DD-metalloendopeptidase family protein [Streptomyces sp. ActVer]